MKKQIVLSAAIILAAAAMTSCGNKEETVAKSGKVEINGSSESSVTTAADVSSAETAETTEITETSETSETSATTAPDKETAAAESSSAAKTEPSKTTTASAAATTTTTTTTTTSKTATTTTVTETKAASTTAKTSTAAASKPGTSTTTSVQKPQAGFTDTDAAIIYNGASIAVDSDFENARAKLGTPDSKQENPNCLTGTVGYTYIYGSTMINVYTKDGKEYVEAVTADSDKNVSTAKGIAVGDSASEIESVYGKGSVTDFMVEYRGDNATLVFYTDGGKVTGIFITKNY